MIGMWVCLLPSDHLAGYSSPVLKTKSAEDNLLQGGDYLRRLQKARRPWLHTLKNVLPWKMKTASICFRRRPRERVKKRKTTQVKQTPQRQLCVDPLKKKTHFFGALLRGCGDLRGGSFGNPKRQPRLVVVKLLCVMWTGIKQTTLEWIEYVGRSVIELSQGCPFSPPLGIRDKRNLLYIYWIRSICIQLQILEEPDTLSQQ